MQRDTAAEFFIGIFLAPKSKYHLFLYFIQQKAETSTYI